MDVFKITAGFVSSLFLLAKERPLLVFSKGGYVSVPVVAAAGLLKIPVFTHESDYDPGMATRINSRFAEKILTSFEQTSSFFKGRDIDKVSYTGNPVRPELASGDPVRGKAYVGCPQGKKLVLFLGGSQGAHAINDAVARSLDELATLCFVVHQTGARHYDPVARDGYYSAPFFGEELADIIASADLVVSRAGSNTLWELAAAGKPSVLVPLESGSRGDQVRNASVFEASGASLVVREGPGFEVTLLDIICKLIDNDHALIGMGKAAHAISKPDAARLIADILYSRLHIERKGE